MRIFPLIGFTMALLLDTIFANGQSAKNDCSVQIILLKFDTGFSPTGRDINNRVLLLAHYTDSVVLENSDLINFTIQTDTIYGFYTGHVFITSHQYTLTDEAAARLSSMIIPMCCGIPVAIKIRGREVYRAMIWNPTSTKVNKSVTMILVKGSLTVTNELPKTADHRNRFLADKRGELECLLNMFIEP